MGEHDNAVLTGRYTRGEDAHEDIYDDGRTLRPVDMDEYVGRGAGSYDEAYSDTPVYRYSHDKKLIPDTVHVHTRPFSVTKWESIFSTLFGRGAQPANWVCPSCEAAIEPSFTPVIDESYRVVGHLGWIDGLEIRVPKNTVEWDSPVAHIFEERRLGEDRRRILAMHDRPLSPFPVHPATTSPALESRWEPFIASLRKGPLKDASDEQRHQNNINYFLAGGGTALVGRDYVQDLMPGWECVSFLPGAYRCMALVRPDGYVQSVLRVEKIPHESRRDRILGIIFEVIDIALTVWTIIDIAIIAVALYRLGVLLAERAAIRAIELSVDGEAKAALNLAKREAGRVASDEAADAAAKMEMRDLTEAELKAARGGGPEGGGSLIPGEDLNKFVPQEKPGMGPKRRLTPNERAGATKIIDILQKMRGAPDLDKQIAQMLEDLGKDGTKRKIFEGRLAEIAKKDKIARMLKDLGGGTLDEAKFINQLADIGKKDERIAKMLKDLAANGEAGGKKFMNELAEFAKNVEKPPPWEFIKELVAKELEHGKLAQQGWKEIYVTEAGVGALNQMRVLFRNVAGGLEAKLMQMH